MLLCLWDAMIALIHFFCALTFRHKRAAVTSNMRLLNDTHSDKYKGKLGWKKIIISLSPIYTNTVSN